MIRGEELIAQSRRVSESTAFGVPPTFPVGDLVHARTQYMNVQLTTLFADLAALGSDQPDIAVGLLERTARQHAEYRGGLLALAGMLQGEGYLAGHRAGYTKGYNAACEDTGDVQ